MPLTKKKNLIERSEAQKAAQKANTRSAIRGIAVKALMVVIAIAVCSVLPVFLNNAFGYVPIVFVLLAIVGDFAYLQVLVHAVQWRQEARVGDCPRGEDVLFRIRVENHSILYCFHATAHFYVSDMFGGLSQDFASSIVLGPLSKEDFDITVRFEHLGTYSAGIDRIEFSGFLGLFTRTVKGENQANVQVTPTIHPIENLGFSTDTPSDSHVALKTVADDSLNYSGVREYHRGDPLKRMHWALSAKGNKTLYTKVFETPTNPGVCIILDFTAPSGLTADELMGMFDTVVETAFSIDDYARKTGIESELQFVDRYGEAVQKRAWARSELAEIVEDMPRMQPDGDTSRTEEVIQKEAQSLYGQSNIVICTAHATSSIVEATVGVKVARRNPVLVLAIPQGLTERERKRWCAPLERLDLAGIGYSVLQSTDTIEQVNIG